MKKMFNNRRMVTWIKAAIGAVVLTYVLISIDWSVFAARLSAIQLMPLLLLFTIGFLDRCLMGYKWNFLLRTGKITLRHAKAISIYFVGSFLGNWTPGGFGADAYRITALSYWNKNSFVLSTVVLERAIGLLVLLIFVSAALPFSASYFSKGASEVSWAAFAVFAVVILLFFLSLNKRVNLLLESFFNRYPKNNFLLKVHSFIQAYMAFSQYKSVLISFFLLTLIEAALTYFHSYLAASAMGLDISLIFFFVTMPILHFLLRLPISIQGIGIQEGLFAYLVGLAGYNPSDGVAVSLLLRVNGIFAVYIPASLMIWLDRDDAPLLASQKK